MKTEDIIEKYPKIFENYAGNPGHCNWYGVPEGWLPIIHDLCGSIQDYIDYTSRSYDNPDYIEGKLYDKNDSTTWKYLQKNPEQVTCTQMKEKFGGLRFYSNNEDDNVMGMIRMAEYLCDHTCQECGTRESVGIITKGWITTICNACTIPLGDRAIESWQSLKEFYEVREKRKQDLDESKTNI